MDEIRFSPPPREVPVTVEEGNGKNKKNRFANLFRFFNFRKILKFLIIIAILAAVILAVFLGRDFVTGFFKTKADVYSAVFLSNGQVYFGKMTKNNASEIVLSDVFYIQINENGAQAQAQLAQTKFSLIKLGNELHGPTDELFINRSQVVFYEKLRDDSKVVESIKNYKP
jgi:hypothetical protein